jgi:hypothetical protein
LAVCKSRDPDIKDGTIKCKALTAVKCSGVSQPERELSTLHRPWATLRVELKANTGEEKATGAVRIGLTRESLHLNYMGVKAADDDPRVFNQA